MYIKVRLIKKSTLVSRIVLILFWTLILDPTIIIDSNLFKNIAPTLSLNGSFRKISYILEFKRDFKQNLLEFSINSLQIHS